MTGTTQPDTLPSPGTHRPVRSLSLALALALGLSAALVATACDAEPGSSTPLLAEAGLAAPGVTSAPQGFPVAGTGVHFFSTAQVHEEEPTESGLIRRSTDIVELSGDLEGFVLYHATSVFDFAAETLVTTGTQMFSGTVAGSAPLLLHDDRFRFDVNLATGAVEGRVSFGRSQDAPHPGSWVECELVVTGTGATTPAGDDLVTYQGTCTPRGRSR
jgi:hypothetical protein